MHYIIQSNLHQDDGMIKLKETLTRFNLSWSEHKVIPFVGDLYPEPKLDHKNVICFGSYSMRHYARKMEWNPGVFDCEKYDHQLLNIVWKDNMLNYDATFCTFEDSLKYVKSCINTYGAAFIRPIHDTKVFAGTVIYDSNEFEKWWKSVCILEEDDGTSLRKSTDIMICIPLKIISECRFFIVNNKLIAGSIYKINDKIIYQEINKDHEFWINAERIMNNLPMKINLKSYVMDFASIEINGKIEYKIVEINTMNSAGLYACDPQKIIMELEQ